MLLNVNVGENYGFEFIGILSTKNTYLDIASGMVNQKDAGLTSYNAASPAGKIVNNLIINVDGPAHLLYKLNDKMEKNWRGGAGAVIKKGEQRKITMTTSLIANINMKAIEHNDDGNGPYTTCNVRLETFI